MIQFAHRPTNALEKGGGEAAALSDTTRPCPNCRRRLSRGQLRESDGCCPHCGYHFRISARQRIRLVVDTGSFSELYSQVKTTDPLSFPGYKEKLRQAELRSGEGEAVLCGMGSIGGNTCALFAMEPSFFMGSMGTAVGEKLTRLFEEAIRRSLPVVGFTVSGGARMQEGILSLMQMAKVSGAVGRHSSAGLLYVTVLTDATTGGVTASFAMEGDILLAEPGATIGFAGRRVIEQTTHGRLPARFQTAESLLDHGFLDAIVNRSELRDVLSRLLRLHNTKENMDEFQGL